MSLLVDALPKLLDLWGRAHTHDVAELVVANHNDVLLCHTHTALLDGLVRGNIEVALDERHFLVVGKVVAHNVECLEPRLVTLLEG